MCEEAIAWAQSDCIDGNLRAEIVAAASRAVRQGVAAPPSALPSQLAAQIDAAWAGVFVPRIQEYVRYCAAQLKFPSTVLFAANEVGAFLFESVSSIIRTHTGRLRNAPISARVRRLLDAARVHEGTWYTVLDPDNPVDQDLNGVVLVKGTDEWRTRVCLYTEACEEALPALLDRVHTAVFAGLDVLLCQPYLHEQLLGWMTLDQIAMRLQDSPPILNAGEALVSALLPNLVDSLAQTVQAVQFALQTPYLPPPAFDDAHAPDVCYVPAPVLQTLVSDVLSVDAATASRVLTLPQVRAHGTGPKHLFDTIARVLNSAAVVSLIVQPKPVQTPPSAAKQARALHAALVTELQRGTDVSPVMSRDDVRFVHIFILDTLRTAGAGVTTLAVARILTACTTIHRVDGKTTFHLDFVQVGRALAAAPCTSRSSSVRPDIALRDTWMRADVDAAGSSFAVMLAYFARIGMGVLAPPDLSRAGCDTCTACGDENILSVATCGHLLCATCGLRLACGRIASDDTDGSARAVYACPMPMCDKPLDASSFELPPVYKRVMAGAARRAQRAAAALVCSACDGQEFNGEGVVRMCAGCGTQMCVQCGLLAHFGVACVATCPTLCAEDALSAVKQQQCPGCRVPTTKDAKCNHMVCERCRTHWCWACGLYMSSTSVDAHFATTACRHSVYGITSETMRMLRGIDALLHSGKVTPEVAAQARELLEGQFVQTAEDL